MYVIPNGSRKPDMIGRDVRMAIAKAALAHLPFVELVDDLATLPADATWVAITASEFIVFCRSGTEPDLARTHMGGRPIHWMSCGKYAYMSSTLVRRVLQGLSPNLDLRMFAVYQ